MKKIEITCHEQRGSAIEFVLKKYKVPYHLNLVMYDEDKLLRYTAICLDILASNLVNELNKIVDTRQKEVLITSQTIDATLSEYINKLEEEEKEKHKKVEKKKLSEEFKEIVEPSVEFNKNLLFMIIIAASVATVGLFANNASLVIGAMLISPLLGPITAFSFNVAVGKPQKVYKATISGLILLAAVIATGTILTAIALQFSDLPMTNEILSRTEISPVYLGVAIALGFAGGIAMTTKIPGILVGVAIAAALVPPATVAGIGIALWNFSIFSSALTLTAANVIGLILGTTAVFFIEGITPRRVYEKEKARSQMWKTIAIFIGLSVILGFLLLKPD
ncbi:MAG: TIGR00341 family protein [Crenarchaeota archaeon]|nr:MAG: TIGR00341 family protein [Thermoproteota archaeon]RDJ32886.1 MAG: TIGR00341 family protein [Thermoproteota archaeon]RDJ36032.1 MAG: TIGR00341 family protein [Thermoproteota archaeon]RDJ38280.1 MAG: TIGR00341 family protein [Thermoproteota archaeon]